MKIDCPIKLHNKFEIEVKNIDTGEIVQTGYAENIVLNNLFQDGFVQDTSNFFGYGIAFGRGTGALDPNRTTLFNPIGAKIRTRLEEVRNQAPLPSYQTSYIVLNPGEYTGETLTEVGVTRSTVSPIYTHALIKDSEGNPLILGPLEANQEVTIYRTIYFQPQFEDGVLLSNVETNAIFNMATGYTGVALSMYIASENPKLFINDIDAGFAYFLNTFSAGVLSTPLMKLLTSHFVGTKIKTIRFRPETSGSYRGHMLLIDLPTLAQNNSALWSGHDFIDTPIGVGDGSTTTFNLTWDEVRLDKPKTVYVDGVEVTTGVTWTVGSVSIVPAPSALAVISGDYSVDYMPKDNNHEAWIQINITFAEGVAS